MKAHRWFVGLAVALVALTSGNSVVADLAFNVIDGFDTQTPNTQDPNFTGAVTVLASGTYGVPASSGANFAEVVPGANDSYQSGYRDGPYAFPGYSQAYPAGSSPTYSFVTDIYTQSTSGSSGYFWWTNGVLNNNDGLYLTETGFQVTPGASTWAFTTTAGGNPVANLAANTWYTLEVEYNKSASNVSATHNIYAAGQRGISAPLYSYTIPSGSMYLNPVSTDLGGPGYSWFTVWDNNAVGAIYIDNFGTAAVPEAGSVFLVGAVSLVGAIGVRLRRRMAVAK
jgi:hypothetical protein